MLALEIVEMDPWTPTIRPTWETRFQHDLAIWKPRRFSFGLRNMTPLSSDEIQAVEKVTCGLVSVARSFPGLTLALRRFNDAVERYEPDDPERVLEYGIALEAIYLNDLPPSAEIGYRLRLRLARFLEPDPAKRSQLLDCAKALYELRSHFAHLLKDPPLQEFIRWPVRG